jgi:ubiquinone/menaquinone biosynthesis C-methylase UbiE
MPPERPDSPPVCDYEGSDYQQRFWEQGDRQYEDQVEAIAIRRLLPKQGNLLLEVGAGAGRNTPRYQGYERVVLMDYSATQLEQAQALLGKSERYIYVAADVYRMPFVDGLFDGATMIRALHHMADAPKALAQIRGTLEPNAIFLLEYASKLHLKAIGRYLLGRQGWSPFNHEPVEFIELNFNFHPAVVRAWLRQLGFRIQRQLTVSHFRLDWLKRHVPLRLLVGLDALFQYTGALWQLTPSVFVRAQADDALPAARAGDFFKCPECGAALPEAGKRSIDCRNCGARWGIEKGIYNFKAPLKG